MPIPKITTSLRITGDQLDPDEVTRLLGCEPNHAVRKGQDVVSKRFIRASLTGIWSIQLRNGHQGTLDEQIRELLSKVTNEPVTWKELASRFSCELFVGVFLESPNQGFQVSAETLKECARRSLRISFDIYHTSDEGG